MSFIAAMAIGMADVALAASLPTLKVTVTAKLQSVDHGASFPMMTEIQNTGKTAQTLRIWLCSYDAHWKTDNPSVGVEGTVCGKNFLRDVKLGPGESYMRGLSLRADIQPAAPPHELVTFRLGFIDGAQEGAITMNRSFVWSNPVTIKVVQPKSK